VNNNKERKKICS